MIASSPPPLGVLRPTGAVRGARGLARRRHYVGSELAPPGHTPIPTQSGSIEMARPEIPSQSPRVPHSSRLPRGRDSVTRQSRPEPAINQCGAERRGSDGRAFGSWRGRWSAGA